MPTPKKATASAVSRALTAAGMTKSEKYKIRIGHHATRGFRATNETTLDPTTNRRVPAGIVTVTWVSGNFARLPGDQENEHAQLGRATGILAGAGYDVEAHVTPGGYMRLTVTRRPAAAPQQED